MCSYALFGPVLQFNVILLELLHVFFIDDVKCVDIMHKIDYGTH
jgi:hypothetical protein